jgi:ubiquinone/menaquinone biosynthesis C-methylase UbiE
VPGEAVYDDLRLAELYDYFNPWDDQDAFYLEQARRLGGPTLDLGCGTGRLAVHIAEEVQPVVGVEPAIGMITVARRRAGTERVEWIQASGQSFQTSARFALGYMTGHAFQAVRSSDEATALLANVARHLAPDGQFIFETRNPADRAWDRWAGDRTVIDTEKHGPVRESYEVAERPDGLISLTHHIHLFSRGEELLGHSRLRFPTREQIESECEAAGLDLVKWYGDWDGGPLREDSVEMIAVTGVKG